MERDPQGGSDVGRDYERDLGDEVGTAIRDSAPDYLAPIDADAPVSGHQPAPEQGASPADTPEQDWATRQGPPLPGLPPGRHAGSRARQHRPGEPGRPRDPEPRPADHRRGPGRAAGRLHHRCRRLRHRRQRRPPADLGRRARRGPGRRDPQPRGLVGDGAVDRRGVGRAPPHQLGHRATAGMPRGSCCRRSSPTSSPSSARSAGSSSGIPERHLMTAGSLRPGDDDFASLFAEFIVEQSGGADEPIDRRVFELVDGRLVEFAGI